MMMRKAFALMFGSLSLAIVLASSTIARAEAPELVAVGNPGNPSDGTGYGKVAYAYKIGKYEVTNEQYAEFLNAAAKSDSRGLYDGRMAEQYGGIMQSGSAGNYKYTVLAGRGKRPVNWVTVHSAARYCNWLSNGQGTGDTEKGTYTITDDSAYGIKAADHAALAAGAKVAYALPSENEWYKAAYYDAKKGGSGGYWQYPVAGGGEARANLNTDNPSEVGAQGAASPYGTYDQAGNMWEFSDSRFADKFGLRGGSFYINDHAGYTRSDTRYDVYGAKWPNYGFRIVALGGDAAAPAATPAK